MDNDSTGPASSAAGTHSRSRSPRQSTPQTGQDPRSLSGAPVSNSNNLTLRALIDPPASKRFRTGGVADTQVDMYYLDRRLAAMQRALVAHAALGKMLSQVDVPSNELPKGLLDAIAKAQSLGLVQPKEVNWLKWIQWLQPFLNWLE